MSRETRWSDDRMAQGVGRLLKGGVSVAAGVTAAGGLALLLQHGAGTVDYHSFRGEPAELRGIVSVVSAAARLQVPAVIQLGIVLLLATPVARVLLSLVEFVLRRDRLYTTITSVVLALLLYGLFLGGRI
ncbi:MAG TPA: DUF1634 domain-containing protein [Gemmatimonadales bacterium]